MAASSSEELDITSEEVQEALTVAQKEIDDAKAAEEARLVEKKKADEKAKTAPKTAESSSKPNGSDGSTAGSSSTPIDEDVKHLLELTPRLPEIVTDMWNSSALTQGWEIVAAATQNKYGARLATLSREVYGAYKKAMGSPEGLQELIKTHTPRQIEQKNPPATPSAAPPAANPAQNIIIQQPNSSSN